MLCAVPALRALRAAYPECEITLIGLPWARAFAARFDRYLDGFLEFPGFPGLPEQPARTRHIPFFLRDAQRRGFDLVLQMHGSGRLTNPIVALLEAAHYAGFRDGNGYCPDDPSHFLPWPAGGHEIHRLLQLTTYLGFPSRGEHLEFPIRDADREELHELPATRALVRGEYVCIHPGARHPAKRWSPEHFAAVADALADAGLTVVLTGTLSEAHLTRAVAGAMRATPIDTAGPMRLGALAALMRDARLVVCNDTGVSHLACAVGVPSVVIFLAADPERWAPLDTIRHRVVYDARSCRHRAPDRPLAGRACPDGVTADIVLAEAEPLLAAERAYAA
ncbi:MAG TPA: glycosyltransferase family 9 protein [Gemmatimonadaceae bacterium]|jgi:ADP-heptose:LPS heptosyltransferase|nr:glycosyltransferase family 9 protein [Gemmatimonadaceae bacterium]